MIEKGPVKIESDMHSWICESAHIPYTATVRRSFKGGRMARHNEESERKARRILEYLKAHVRYGNGFLPRPFFVELTGSPSSGKTSIITELYKFMRRLGFRVLRPQEGAEVIQHIPRTTPVYNVRTALYALTMVLDEAHKHTYDLILLDRGLYDPYGWMMYWRDRESPEGRLSSEECVIFQKFFLSPWWIDLIDKAFFVVCEPEEAMRRELRIAITDRLGETTNPASVAKLVKRYRDAYDQLSPTHPRLELIDTTHVGEQEMVDLFSRKVLDAMEARIPGTS
jgi:hypothetical protein